MLKRNQHTEWLTKNDPNELERLRRTAVYQSASIKADIAIAFTFLQIARMDGEGREVDAGELGEILIKGPNVMKGYFGNPQATAEAIRNGWLHSGDIGYRDPEGYYFLVDRVKDMINVAGFKVFPREVEEVLFRHAAVKEAAVVGVADPVRGEAVKAFVVLQEGRRVTPEELRKICHDAIASYKVPETIEFLDALPKNPTGKILKKELRKLG